MKIAKPQIIIIQHFNGKVKQAEMFRRIIAAQAEKKLKTNGVKSDTQ